MGLGRASFFLRRLVLATLAVVLTEIVVEASVESSLPGSDFI